MKCPACGRDNPADSRFCSGCGHAVAATCAACNAELPPDATFCNQCGHAVATRPPSPDSRAYTPKHLAEKILQSRSALEGERKQLTVLFADVRGSMDLAEEVGAEEWHRILDRYFEILTEGIHRFEGTVNQYTGDGVMALFGAPVALEDHAQRACFAALHLRDRLREFSHELRRERALDFQTRIGLNSGDVIVGKIGDDLRMDYTAQGQTVGLAQRIEQLAEVGKPYLTASTAALVEGYFQLEDLGAFNLRGSRTPISIFELQGTGSLRTRLDVSRVRGFSRFVGRAEEMATLHAALHRAMEGNGQVVGIVAGAGLGKSRLCLEFVDDCQSEGLPIYQAHCPTHGKSVPLLPLRELLRDFFGITDGDTDREARRKIAGELALRDEAFRSNLPLIFDLLGVDEPGQHGLPLDSNVREDKLFAFIRRLVRSEREPSVWFVDDLHWIDAASDAFLAQIVEAISGSSALLLLNFRPEYEPEWARKSYYQQLPLVPLRSDALGELLVDLVGRDPSVSALPLLIGERTGGNPFFAEELVQSLIESGHLQGSRGSYRLITEMDDLEVPDTVQSVLAARIDRLGEVERQVLRAAAVIGRRFGRELLEQVLELPRVDLDAAVVTLRDAEFIYETSLYPVEEYSFKHPLTQHVAYDAQLQERRARTHAAVASALEALASESLDEHASLLAYHCERADQAAQALRWHRTAAEWARERDPPASARHWQSVRSLVSTLPESRDTGEMELLACRRLMELGLIVGLSREAARSLFERGRELARDDPHSLARLMHSYAELEGTHSRFTDMEQHAMEALRLAQAADDLYTQLTARNSLMRVHLWRGRYPEGLELAEESLHLVPNPERLRPRVNVAGAYAHSYLFRGVFLRQEGRLNESIDVLESGIELARELDLDRILVGMCWEAVNALAEVGNGARALELADEAVGVAERFGGAEARLMACLCLAQSRNLMRRWDEVLEATAKHAEIAAETGLGSENRLLALLFAARAHRGLGDMAAAKACATEARVSARTQNLPLVEIDAVIILTNLAVAAGEASSEEVDQLIARLDQLHGDAGVRAPDLHRARARVARARGDRQTSLSELRQAHRLYTEMGRTRAAQRTARQLEQLADSE